MALLYSTLASIGMLLLAQSLECFAQDMLLVSNERKKNGTAYYRVGDEMSFWVEGDEHMVTSRIQGFTDSLIVFDYYRIPVSQITHLYVDDKIGSWYVFRYKTILLPIAGAGYLLADGVNTQELAPSTLLISGSLIGGGFLLKWLIGNRIRIRGRKKLTIVSL